MKVFEFDSCVLTAGFGAGLRISAVNGCVAISPHREERFPDSCNDVGRPEEPGLGVCVRLDLAKVLVLEARPFEGHAALEDLPPADGVLFVDETMECRWIIKFVERDVVEPRIEAVQQDVDEVRTSQLPFEGGAKGFVEAVAPRFTVRMGALEEMSKILTFMLAEVACCGIDRIVPAGQFGGGEDVVT
jgi:hypothetical protein